MTREWIALERHEGRAHDLSLYARALHAQLHRWVDGSGRIDARLEGDLCDAMARSLAFRFGATRGDRRLIAGHLRELVGVGAVVLSADGLELRALADGADLVRHKLAVGDRPQPSKRLRTTEQRSITTRDEAATIGHDRSRTSNEASRTETKDGASARNESSSVARIEESRREEKRAEGEEESARGALAPAPPSTDLDRESDGQSERTEAEPIPAAQQPAQSTLFAESCERPSAESASTGKAPEKSTKPRRERRPKPAPAADPLPAEGTVARRVYDAITTDAALAPITRGPGDLARRLAALCEGTHVDAAAEVISAGAWQLREGQWTDGAAGLMRWVKRDVDRARALPVPVLGAIRTPTDAGRIDYQGRRVVGAAGLPPGSVWEKTKEQHEAEEDELYRRAYAETQPKKGVMGR